MIKDMLNKMLEETINGLEEEVLKSILNVSDEDEELKNYMEDVMNYGCQSGVVRDLLYNYQTNEFFKNNFNEIFDLCNELKEEGMNLEFEITAVNFCWIAYEILVNRLYNELGLEEE